MIFKKLFEPKNENSKRYKRYAAEKINNKALKYVTERNEKNMDVVIGKGGSIHIRDNNRLIVYAEGSDILFQGDIEQIKCSELMSLDGVIIEGFDEIKNTERKIVAHYLYYRK